MKRWYLVYTKPKNEHIAGANLTNQNFEIYCPQAKINNNTQMLFPRYIFVRPTHKTQDMYPIRSTKGVANIVRFGGKVAVVAEKIINDLQRKENTIQEKMKDMQRFHTGDKIKIVNGIFTGNNAIFNTYSGEKRVILLLKLLNQEQKITLDNKQIKMF